MQQLARRHSQKVIDENQNLRSELESKISELNSRFKQLDDLAAKSDYERRNLEQEKQKVCDLLASHIPCFAPFLHLLKQSLVASLIPTCTGERSLGASGTIAFPDPEKSGCTINLAFGVFYSSAS